MSCVAANPDNLSRITSTTTPRTWSIDTYRRHGTGADLNRGRKKPHIFNKMMLARGFKRFPLPMALGNDICRISRIAKLLSREPNKAAKFIRKVLTEEEIRAVRHPQVKRWIEDVVSNSAKDNQSSFTWAEPMSGYRMLALKKTSIFLAGRWAAKEAVIKAHPHRRVTFGDIIVYNSPESLGRHGKEEGRENKTQREGEGEGEEIITNKDDNNNNIAKEEEKVVVDKEGDDDTRWLGRPVAIVRGRKEIGEEDAEVLVSISHDYEYASAVCLSWTGLSSKPGGGRVAKKSGKGTRWRSVEGAGGVV